MQIKLREFRRLNKKDLKERFKLNPRIFVKDRSEVVFTAYAQALEDLSN